MSKDQLLALANLQTLLMERAIKTGDPAKFMPAGRAWHDTAGELLTRFGVDIYARA